MEVVTQEAPAMKVGFSFSKPLAAKKKRDSPESGGVDYVTDISGGNIRSLGGNKSQGPLIIPLSDQGIKRPKTASKDILPSQQHGTATPNQPSTAQSQSKEKTLDELAAEALINDAKNSTLTIDTSNMVILPIILQNQIEGIEEIKDEDERFKYDVASRPDEADSEAYENVPIEEFGKAMLRGMGWESGKPIGLNNRGLAEPIEFVARQGRLGLGATPETVEIKKKYIKPGETRGPKPIMVAPTGPDGKVRHVKGISEKLVPMKKGIVGKLAAIGSGPHEGLYARVIQEMEGDEVAVRLLASEEDVVVAKSDLNLTISENSLAENHPAAKYIAKESSSSKNKEEKSKSKSKPSKSKSKSKSEESSSPTWLHPHIMVRIVSKSFDGGKYYNKKGHIVDVIGRHECIVQLPNGTLVEGIKQKGLETVIPKPGGKVLIVLGKMKGSSGTLLERKKNKENKDCAVVQLFSDLSVDLYELDDIAEYVGAADADYMDM